MFRKTNSKPEKPSAKKDVPSIISADFNLLGNIISDGAIDFNGRIDGNIQCHSLVIRKQGVVNGEIVAESVQVHGKVKGMIRARNVSLLPTAVVEGIIMHHAITIADGAVVDGKMKRIDKPAGDEHMDFDELPQAEAEPMRTLEGFRLISGTKTN